MRNFSKPLPAVLVTFLVFVLLIAVSVLLPDQRAALFEEDRPIEWATVVAFSAACLLGAIAFRNGSRRELMLLAVTLAAGLAALDEMSFGERLIGYEPPRVVGRKVDGVHDFLLVGRAVLREWTSRPYLAVGLLLLAFGGVALAGLMVMVRRGWSLGPPEWLVLPALATIAVCIAQGSDLNLPMLGHPIMDRLYVEEILELIAGVLLLLYVLRFLRRGRAADLAAAPKRI